MKLTKEQEIIKLVTEAVRAADEHFEKVGGSSRHWVRDCFLPELKERGLEIVITLDESDQQLTRDQMPWFKDNMK